jgi:DNA-binding transcriptional MerR regulator
MGLSVGELAERAGVTRRTIRYYVEIGLLQPPTGAGKAAVYGTEHLERLDLIKSLQAYRLSLEEIRERLAGRSGEPSAMMLADRLAVDDAAPASAMEITSASEYIDSLRQRDAFFNRSRFSDVGEAYRREMARPSRRADSAYDAEQWLRITLSEDVELHVRRRASKTDRRLNRLVKEARRILAEEEVE